MAIKISDYVYQIGNTLFFVNPQTNETVSARVGARMEISESMNGGREGDKHHVSVKVGGRRLIEWQFPDRAEAKILVAALAGLEAGKKGARAKEIGKKTAFGTACVLAAYVFLIGLSTIFADMARPDTAAMAYHAGAPASAPPAEPLPPPEDYAAMILEQMRGESSAEAMDKLLSGSGYACPPEG